VADLEAFVSEHPLRERPWHQLALALYRSGRSADALRRIATFRSILRVELGLDPPAATRQLEARILESDPALLGLVAPLAGRRSRRLPAEVADLLPGSGGRTRRTYAIRRTAPRGVMVEHARNMCSPSQGVSVPSGAPDACGASKVSLSSNAILPRHWCRAGSMSERRQSELEAMVASRSKVVPLEERGRSEASARADTGPRAYDVPQVLERLG
jgi:hypothetical protein